MMSAQSNTSVELLSTDSAPAVTLELILTSISFALPLGMVEIPCDANFGFLTNEKDTFGTTLLYEPINRYETNLINTLGDAATMLAGLATQHVKILADLYHMNIEETNLADAIRAAGPRIGHVHFADSNRRAAGMGHTDFGPIVAALRDAGYAGYLSAEVLPLPDPLTAAKQTIESFRRYTL